VQSTSNRTKSPADIPKIAAIMPSPDVVEKERKLRHLMRQMETVLVAYSGGVDSTYLAYVANGELGPKSLCILGLSPSVSAFQREQALATARELGLSFETLKTDEIKNDHYSANPSNRCYFCKDELYAKLNAVASERQIAFVADGMNADDLTDHRPGRIAADEWKVRSPLAEVGLTKNEIRELSRAAGISGWEKPSSPCLASRIAYGTPVTIERLSKVERGEHILREMGFLEFRVRVHDELVRLEIAPAEMRRALDPAFAELVTKRFSLLGFKYVTLDLKGFRSGALNEILE
jgi:uncharacterized protein